MIQELHDLGLFYAFTENKVEILKKVLLSKDFNINKPIQNFFKAEDQFSYAEIEYCANIYPLQILLENHFHFQNNANFLEILQLCIDSGADLNLKQKEGYTFFQMFFIEYSFHNQWIKSETFFQACHMCLKAGAKVNQKYEGESWEFSYVSMLCYIIDQLYKRAKDKVHKHAEYSKKSFDIVSRFTVLLSLVIRRGAYIDYYSLINRIKTPLVKHFIQGLPLRFLFYCFWKKNIHVMF